MGNSFINVKEAALIARVSKRTLYRYTIKGLIRTVKSGKNTFYYEEDVLKLKKSRQDLLSDKLNKDILGRLLSEIHSLKTQVSMIMQTLNMKDQDLQMTEPEYKHFYESAQQYAVEGWPPQVEETWSEYFIRLKIEDLKKLEAITNDPHPWRPILKLATTMCLSSWDRERKNFLAAGRSNIEQIAGMWGALKNETPIKIDQLADRDCTPNKKLIRDMKKYRVF